MTEGTLSPAYFVLNYHSIYGSHKATIPTLQWYPTNITGNLGSFETWNAGTVDAEEMIQTYADNMMQFYAATASTDSAEIWTKDTPTSPAYPRRQYPIISAGTDTVGTWQKATQAQWIVRCADFSIAKYVFLDFNSHGSWDSLSDISGSPDSITFLNHLTDADQAFSSRKDSQPNGIIKITYKLNDQLRKEYEMD